MRVPGAYTTLVPNGSYAGKPNDDDDVGIFESKHTSLRWTGRIRAALPSFGGYVGRITLSLVHSQLPGVPQGATTIPPVWYNEAAHGGGVGVGVSGSLMTPTAAAEAIDPLQVPLAHDMGVPSGYLLSHDRLHDTIPSSASISMNNDQLDRRDIPRGFRERPLHDGIPVVDSLASNWRAPTPRPPIHAIPSHIKRLRRNTTRLPLPLLHTTIDDVAETGGGGRGARGGAVTTTSRTTTLPTPFGLSSVMIGEEPADIDSNPSSSPHHSHDTISHATGASQGRTSSVTAPLDFHLHQRVRLEVDIPLTHHGEAKATVMKGDTHAASIATLDDMETVVYEAEVVGMMLSILDRPMRVEDGHQADTNGILSIGHTFVMQVSNKDQPDTFYDLTLQIKRVLREDDFIDEQMSPPQTVAAVATTTAPSAWLRQGPTSPSTVDGKSPAGSRNAFNGWSSPNGGAATTVIPAGMNADGRHYFYPPVNIPPLPIGYTPDGIAIFDVPPAPKPVPAGYTRDGQAFYNTTQTDDHCEPIGYTNEGTPFVLPSNAKLPVPNGYTSEGIPYYQASSLVEFLKTGQTRPLTSASTPRYRRTTSIDPLVAATITRVASLHSPGTNLPAQLAIISEDDRTAKALTGASTTGGTTKFGGKGSRGTIGHSSSATQRRLGSSELPWRIEYSHVDDNRDDIIRVPVATSVVGMVPEYTTIPTGTSLLAKKGIVTNDNIDDLISSDDIKLGRVVHPQRLSPLLPSSLSSIADSGGDTRKIIHDDTSSPPSQTSSPPLAIQSGISSTTITSGNRLVAVAGGVPSSSGIDGMLLVEPSHVDFGATPATRYALAALTRPPPKSTSIIQTDHHDQGYGRRTVTITNRSDVSRMLQLVSIRPDCFSIRQREAIIAPSSSYDITIEFKPREPNVVYTGMAMFSHNGHQLVIPLRGIGAAAKLQISISSPFDIITDTSALLEDPIPSGLPFVWFPPAKFHQTTRASFTLYNSGLLRTRYQLVCRSSASSFRMALHDSNYGNSAVTTSHDDDDNDGTNDEGSGELTGIIESGQRLTIDVTCLLFVRKQKLYSGNIEVKWQMVPQPERHGIWQTSSILLRALIGEPLLKCDQKELTFEAVVLNRPSLRKIRLDNIGNAVLTWQSSCNDTQLVCEPTNGAIPAGESHIIGVIFTPHDLVYLNQSIRILSDGGDHHITCTGSVIVPQLVVPHLSHDFGIVPTRQTVNHTIELYNAGTSSIDYRLLLGDRILGNKDSTGNTQSAIDPQQIDADQMLHDTQLAQRGELPLPASQPLVFGIYSVSPWCGSIAPRTHQRIEVSCHPSSVSQTYDTMIAICPGISMWQRSSGTTQFRTLDVHVGALTSIGGGSIINWRSHLDRQRASHIWQTDLGLDPALIFVPHVLPLGMVDTDGQASDEFSLSIENTGNSVGRFAIRAISGASLDLGAAAVARSALAAQMKRSHDIMNGGDDDIPVFSIEPSEGSVAGGSQLYLRINIDPHGDVGFLQQQFELTVSDSPSRQTFTLLAYAGDSRVSFVTESINWGKCQIGRVHARSAWIRNDGNRTVSLLCSIMLRRSQALQTKPPTTTAAGSAANAARVARTSSIDSKLAEVVEEEYEGDDEEQPSSEEMAACPFKILTDTITVAAHTEMAFEIQYHPTIECDNEAAQLMVQWLGPTLVLPLSGSGGTGRLQLVFPQPPVISQSLTLPLRAGHGAATALPGRHTSTTSIATTGANDRLEFGRCLIGQTHWKSVMVRNTGSLELEFNVAIFYDTINTLPFIKFAAPTVTEGIHRLAAAAGTELQIGVVPTHTNEVHGRVVITSGVGDATIPVSVTGGRFVISGESQIDFGEIAIDLPQSRIVTVRNTGDLSSRLTLMISPSLRALVHVALVPSGDRSQSSSVSGQLSVTSSVTSSSIARSPRRYSPVDKRTPSNAASSIIPGLTFVSGGSVGSSNRVGSATSRGTVAAVDDTLSLKIEPGDEFDFQLLLQTSDTRPFSGTVTLVPDLAGAESFVCNVTGEACAMKLTVIDRSPMDLGKVMLNNVATLTRNLQNGTRTTPLRYRIELAGDEDNLKPWSIMPTSGTLEPRGVVTFTLTYQSSDADRNHWHDITIRIINQTHDTVDCVLTGRASVAYPRLALFPVVPRAAPDSTRDSLLTRTNINTTGPPRLDADTPSRVSQSSSGGRREIVASFEFGFGCRLINRIHYRQFGVRNDGTGQVEFTMHMIPYHGHDSPTSTATQQQNGNTIDEKMEDSFPFFVAAAAGDERTSLRRALVKEGTPRMFVIGFRPSMITSYRAIMVIESPVGSERILLYGEGATFNIFTTPIIALEPSAPMSILDFGQVAIGDSASQLLTIGNLSERLNGVWLSFDAGMLLQHRSIVEELLSGITEHEAAIATWEGDGGIGTAPRWGTHESPLLAAPFALAKVAKDKKNGGLGLIPLIDEQPLINEAHVTMQEHKRGKNRGNGHSNEEKRQSLNGRERWTIQHELFTMHPESVVLAPSPSSSSDHNKSLVVTNALESVAAKPLSTAKESFRTYSFQLELKPAVKLKADGTPDDTSFAMLRPATTPTTASLGRTPSFRPTSIVNSDQSSSIVAVAAATEAALLHTKPPLPVITYERMVHVLTMSHGVVSILLRASLTCHAIDCSRSEIDFYKTLTNAAVYRRFHLTNPASYHVPYTVTSSHEAFTCTPVSGIIGPRGSVECVVKFHSQIPLDTADRKQFTQLPHLTITTLMGLLAPIHLPMFSVCTDYIFNTHLLQDINFGNVQVNTTEVMYLKLQNVSESDVHYSLVYDRRDCPVMIKDNDREGLVKHQDSRTIALHYHPMNEGPLRLTIGIETRAGTFNVEITGEAIVPHLEITPNKLDFGLVGVSCLCRPNFFPVFTSHSSVCI
jgi:hypothetical protein